VPVVEQIAPFLSLACNVYAGSNLGERAFGVLVVGAFMLLEHHATKAGRESIVPVTTEIAAELAAKRSAAARKGAQTKARNKAQATRKPRAPKPARTPVEEIEALVSVAPVSRPPLGEVRVTGVGLSAGPLLSARPGPPGPQIMTYIRS